ncbi:MAG: FAD:protein FMN transferase [bacterium]|nr:FAD:protein FMN transferase [bacterium]
MPFRKWLFTSILLTLILPGCTRNVTIKRTEFIMGTWVDVTVVAPNKKVGEEVVESAFHEFKRIESLMSNYKATSEISRLNRIGSARVSKETLEVINKAIAFSIQSRGAFDITCKPLLDLWREARFRKRIPTKDEIKEKLALVGYENLDIEGNKVTFKIKGMGVDLGGIAKGYAVDKAIKILKEKGIKQALVNAGGDIYVLGRAPKREKWRIGIQHPRKEKGILEVIKIRDRAIATSGDYERYFTLGGKRYSHIVNPKTGYTVASVPMSVTIIASDCTEADALATTCFVLGDKEGIELIDSLLGVEGMIVSEGMKVFTSKGWDSITGG